MGLGSEGKQRSLAEVGAKRYYTRKEASQIPKKSGSDTRGRISSGQLQYEYVENRWMLTARCLEAFPQGGEQVGGSDPSE